MDHNDYALEADKVTKVYSRGILKKTFNSALKGVSLKVPKGKIFGLLGPNGAGKTTLVNVFAGQLKADSGEIFILGQKLSSLRKSRLNVLKERMNMCSGAPNFPWSFTTEEILNFYAMLYGMKHAQRHKKIKEYLEMFELERFKNATFDSLSSGTKQKVALAKSLLNEPEILFLDEPTIGLDPDIAIKIRKRILEINKKWQNTIVLTTHYMKEAEELCAKIAFIKEGKISAVGTSAELKQLTKSRDLEEAFLELNH